MYSPAKPTVCDDAWVSYLTGNGETNWVTSGKLTAGFGSLWGRQPGELGDKIGPEFTFGLTMATPAKLPEFAGNVVAVETAPFWSDELGIIDAKRGQINQMRYFLDSKHKDYANADGQMTQEEMNEYLRKYEADLISPEERAWWERGAPNAGYHYLGCAKTFARMGQAFAEANLRILEKAAR